MEICQGGVKKPWVNGQAEKTIGSLSRIINKHLDGVNINELTLEQFNIKVLLATSVYNNTCKLLFFF